MKQHGRTLPGAEVLTRAAPPPDLVIRYGAGEEQVADVRLPPRGRPGPAPLVVFLHGGFWRAEYDRAHTGPFATALAAAGYIVCVPEFRRSGQPGGGWPGTFDDIAAAVDRLPGQVLEGVTADEAEGAVPGTGEDEMGAGEPGARPASERRGVDLGGSGGGRPGGPARGGTRRVLVAGHSAGGHLALWAAARPLLPSDLAWQAEDGTGERVDGVVALAAVSSLARCARQGLGQGAADAFMGGGPDEYPQRYGLADPSGLLPLPCPVRLVHGGADDRVPCAMSCDYAAHARSAGSDVVLDELPGAGHFDVIDPLSPAWPRVLAAFQALAPAGAAPAV